MKKHKALALYSGGLDSILACRVIMNQGIEVKAIHFITPFFGYDKKGREDEARDYSFAHYGIKLEIIDVSHDYLEVVKHPQHGYGKNLNPCLDCKIFLISKARKLLDEEGASFLITGEVLGQRPMSQRRDAMRIIERDSETEGILLRPLCARHLKPTIPEERGWVDRDKLLDFKGRGRKSQMMLAEQLGIEGYPTPAGGCLLTDSEISARIRRLLNNCADVSIEDLLLIKVGRHFALSEETLLVVGRFEDENKQIERRRQKGDTLLELSENPGPLSLLRGHYTPEILEVAASITVRYSKAREDKQVKVAYREEGNHLTQEIRVDPISDQDLDNYRIGNLA
jgi:tRNA U34 2-thiouridine synthase MnmA/TrmU